MVRAQVAGSAFQELAAADPQLVLYRRGERSGTFTLILQGRVLIHTGTYEPAVVPYLPLKVFCLTLQAACHAAWQSSTTSAAGGLIAFCF